MIKRPVLFLFSAFLAGAVGYEVLNSSGCWVMLCILGMSEIFYVYHQLHQKKPIVSYANERCLLLLPVFFLIGFSNLQSASQSYPIEQELENKLECSMIGTIQAIDESGAYLKLTLKNTSTTLNQTVYECGKVLVMSEDGISYHIGSKVNCSGTLQKFERAGNPGQFDEAAYYKILGYEYKMFADKITCVEEHISWFWKVTSKLKNRMLKSYRAMLNDEDYGLITAMLLGETSNMDEELKELYQKNGISHILSISGLHITLIGMGIYQMLRKGRLGLIPSIFISILIIGYYGLLTGWSVSTNRAVVMLSIALCAGLFGRTYDVVCAMAISAFFILLQNPLQLYSAGFQLSYTAVLGIVLVNGVIREAFQVQKKWLQAIFISMGAQLATLPFVLNSFYEFPLYSLLLNLLLVPAGSLLIVLPLFAGIVGCFSETLGGILIGGVHYILAAIEQLCRLFANLPGCTQTWGKPQTIRILLYYTGDAIVLGSMRMLIQLRKKVSVAAEKNGVKAEELKLLSNHQRSGSMGKAEEAVYHGVLCQDRSKKTFNLSEVPVTWLSKHNTLKLRLLCACLEQRTYVYLGICLFALGFLFLPARARGLEITMLDVGQGDGIYLESESGVNYLIDGGSTQVKKLGKYRLVPFLKAHGRTSIDTVILTHSDADHTNGILEMMEEGYEIGQLLLPDIKIKEEAYLELVETAQRAGIPVRYLKRGDQIADGELKLTCLHPYPEFVWSSTNSYSTVLSLSYGQFQMLFTGDLEKEGEEALYEFFAEYPMDYDVLKVAHHGSNQSSSIEWLQLIQPEYALISAGKNNTYGHPGGMLLERLNQVNCKYYVTMDSGAIQLKTNGKRLFIEAFCQ